MRTGKCKTENRNKSNLFNKMQTRGHIGEEAKK
jgi:hypothetical protein